MKHLNEILSDAATEEEVKNFFAKFFRIKLSTKNFIDLYTPQIMFEFKFDAPIKNIQIRAKIVAQMLYYVRRLKFGTDYRPLSQNLCIVTKNSAAFFQTDTFADFYDDKSAFDWDLAPSSPCKKLIAALADFKPLIDAHIFDFADIASEINFSALINNTLRNKSAAVKKINEKNFEQVFLYWQKLFGKAVANGRKPSEYFITDIEQGKSEDLRNSVLFRMTGGELVEKFIKPEKYHAFWDFYDKIATAQEIIAIRQKMDRMTEENLRRRTGEFYTPLDFADKAADYLQRTVGDWWLDDNFRLWDMAAGTGNLEFNFPREVLKKCYISTLIDDDADYCKSIFPDAAVFQYDYLNDDETKLPDKLRADLANPNIKWIIFINPPYATAGNNSNQTKEIKIGVSMTAVRNSMREEDLGDTSQELYAQFIYRINRDFAGRKAWLGMFSSLKYIKSGQEKNFRDKIFRYKFERGFIFNSKNFQGCTGQFPVGFLIWNLADKIPLESQEILLDVYNNAAEKIAEKTFCIDNTEKFLNIWAKRSRGVKKFPPMSSGLNIAYGSRTPKDKVAENFLATFVYSGNDFANQNFTSFVSGSVARHGGISVTPENFEQCMITHMVRRLPKANWLNNKDQFMQPTKNLPEEFISDAVIWSLFAPSNQTVSLRDVEYEGEIYRIPNNFYPFELSEVRNWQCTSPEIRMQLAMATDDRFAAIWIKNHELSPESRAILSSARAIYRKFYAELENLEVMRWKIADWDAGWYQVRMSLGATIDLTPLSTKLLPQIYELGFLRDEVRYF